MVCLSEDYVEMVMSMILKSNIGASSQRQADRIFATHTSTIPRRCSRADATCSHTKLHSSSSTYSELIKATSIITMSAPIGEGFTDPNFPNPQGPNDASIIIYGCVSCT